jgi:murein DD-endopeptidase MepM/ murein hydrolase activator NlpD
MGKGRNKIPKKIITGSLAGFLVPLLGCMSILFISFLVIIIAAGSILGWLFGGGAPSGEGNVTPPSGPIANWTPTPIPTISGTVTPPPNWTPPADGERPHGMPYRSAVVVTQEYGCTDFPEFADPDCNAQSGGAKPYFHRGIDLVATSDKTIYATATGQVSFAGWGDDGFGNRVYIISGPYKVIYAHLSAVRVTSGQFVQWGQPIGVEGSTGYSTGSHLHYEIHVNNQWIDPAPYLLPLT